MGTPKPWIRWVNGQPRPLLYNGVPMYSQRCCCASCPPCILARVFDGTGSGDGSVDRYVQLERTAQYACNPADPSYPTQCIYLPSPYCPAGGVGLYRFCDGTCRVTLDGIFSDYLLCDSVYGAFSFPGHPELQVVTVPRYYQVPSDITLCGDKQVCVRYMKVGSSWDVVRLVVPVCALPEYWQDGWLEDEPFWGTPDYFQVDVMHLNANAENCRWTEDWAYLNLCASRNGESWTLLRCPLFPQPGAGACTLYDRPIRWARDLSSDADTLFGCWDGTFEYLPGGGGGPTYSNPTGPYGTYGTGADQVEVYACTSSG